MPKKKQEKKKIVKPKPDGYVFGRPTIYSEELADKICDAVATNPVGFDTIRKLYQFPMSGVIREWRRKHPNFNAKYLTAKSFQAELMVEEIDDMLPHEIKTYLDDRGNERIDAPSASLAIAKVNNRKWTAARLAPKRYGDVSQLDTLKGENEELKKEMEELRAQLDQKHKKDY